MRGLPTTRRPSRCRCSGRAAFAAADDELRTDVEPSLVLLTFPDGTRVEADVVIGADGVHSTVRGAVTEPSPATYSRIESLRLADKASPWRRIFRVSTDDIKSACLALVAV
jgi:2-polyprenyl-6-methoxyphenol hydroxylase-like FAD-dependent oxidoreductase